MAAPRKQPPKPRTQSAAEKQLRQHTPQIVARITEKGATLYAAARASGYTNRQTRDYRTIGEGGMPEVTDTGLRRACESFASKTRLALADYEMNLGARWQELAIEGDDWRAIAELLKRRNPDEWNPTDRSEISLDADVRTETRSDDAVIAALKKLQGDTP